MKRITKLIVLLAIMLIPAAAKAASDVTIENKSYDKVTHVFHVDGNAPGKYVIVALYDNNSQLAMYVAEVKNGTYSADIKISFKKVSTVTIKVGDINGTNYAKTTLEVEKSLIDITKAKVSGIVAKTYNGTYQKQKALKVVVNNKTLKEGTDYKLLYSNNKNAGTAKFSITGLGNYGGKIYKTFKINKAANTLTYKYVTKTVYYSKVKNAAQVVKPITIVKRQGTMSYSKVSGSARLTINKTTGKVTVKKGTAKGTYKIKVKITASATANYNLKSRTVTLTIKVK